MPGSSIRRLAQFLALAQMSWDRRVALGHSLGLTVEQMDQGDGINAILDARENGIGKS